MEVLWSEFNTRFIERTGGECTGSKGSLKGQVPKPHELRGLGECVTPSPENVISRMNQSQLFSVFFDSLLKIQLRGSFTSTLQSKCPVAWPRRRWQLQMMSIMPKTAAQHLLRVNRSRQILKGIQNLEKETDSSEFPF